MTAVTASSFSTAAATARAASGDIVLARRAWGGVRMATPAMSSPSMTRARKMPSSIGSTPSTRLCITVIRMLLRTGSALSHGFTAARNPARSADTTTLMNVLS